MAEILAKRVVRVRNGWMMMPDDSQGFGPFQPGIVDVATTLEEALDLIREWLTATEKPDAE